MNMTIREHDMVDYIAKHVSWIQFYVQECDDVCCAGKGWEEMGKGGD